MKGFKINGLVRISKYNAKQRYNRGETIYICPFKLRPGGPWHPECAISMRCPDGEVQVFAPSSNDFDSIVNEFAHFNCNYSAGKYPAYYIEEVDRIDG